MKQTTNTAATTLEQVNAMPAATWGWLRMNQTKLELSDELAAAPAEAIEVEGLDEQFAGSADAFDAAMEAMAERFPERRASAPGDAADRARITPETELDVPATSVYQTGAIKLEEELSPAEAFETGMGEAAYAYLTEHAAKRIVIDVPAYQHAAVTVRVSGVDAAAAIAAIDVVARPQATLDLQIALDSPVAGEGVVGSVLRVCAHEYATVNVTCTQTLDDSWIALDDTGLFLDEGARVNVQHTVLGAGASATGLAGDLLGDTAKVTIDTDYLGAREQVRDFNYELRHRGRKTECEIDANGVLTGTSKKVYRGTIDLVHGCKGAVGTERETCCWRTRASTTRPSPSSCATRTTSPATTAPPSATSATSSCSTSPAAALTKTPPRTCSSAPSWRTLRFPPLTSAPALPSSAWAIT